MSNQFLKLRRSAVQGKIPETSSLDLGELAINTYDGQLFLKKSGSQGEIVTVVGSTGSFTGSFIGNGAGLIDIPASGITGLNLSRIATGSVSASVNTDISASFRLTSGSNTLLNITKDGFVWIGNGSFVNQGYQLDIQGNTRVNGRLLLGTSTDSGVWQLDVKGDTQISGNVIMSGSNKWIEFRGGPVIIAPTNFSGWAGTSIAGHASGNNSFAIGGAASGTNSHTFGVGSVASATNSHAIGYGTQAVGFASIAIGTGARAGANEFVVGYPYDGGTSNVYFGSGTNRWNGNVQISGSGYSYTINGSGAYGIDFLGGNITIAGGKGTGTGSAGDVIFSTSTPLTTGNILQSLTERWWIKGQTGTLTNKGTSSLAILDVSGSSVFTGSVLITGSTVSLTGGSFSGSGANLYGIPATGITGLNLSQIAIGSVSASVSNTDISASFRVTSGSNTLLNVTKDGFVWIGNGSFVNQGYQLDVQGTGRFTGNINVGNLNIESSGKFWYSNPWGERWAMNLSGDGDMSFTSTKGNQSIIFRGESTYTHIIASSNVLSSINIGTFEGREGYIVATQNANTGNYTAGTARIAAGYTSGTISPGATNTNGVPLYINAANGGGSGFRADIVFQTVDDIAYGPSDTHQLRDRIVIKGGSGNTLISASLYVSGSFVLNGTQFNNTSSVTSAGITTVSQLSTSSYTSCFYNYTVASASNARSGQVMTVWNGSTIRYTEVVTTDIGDTNQVIVSSSLSSGFVRLQVSASAGWTFKNISNLL